MVEGKKIKGACSNFDVAKVLGASSVDIGTLCRSSLINKWARFKPERLARRENNSAQLTNVERKSNNFSLKIPSVNSSIIDAVNDSSAWRYDAPVTGHFANLDDFTNCERIDEGDIFAIGYDGDAPAPIFSVGGTQEDGTLVFDLGRATLNNKVYGNVTIIMQNDMTPTDAVTSRTDISLGDMNANIDGKPLTQWYLAFAFGKKDSDGNITLEGWKTPSATLINDGVAGGISVDISNTEWNREITDEDNYYYFLVASKSAQTSFAKATGSFIALPFSNNLMATGKFIIKKNIVPEGCVVNIGKRVGSAPTFTLSNSGNIEYYSGFGTQDSAILDCSLFMPNYFDVTIKNEGDADGEFLINEFKIEAKPTLVSDQSTGDLTPNVYQKVSGVNELATRVDSDFNVAIGETANLRFGREDLLLYLNGGLKDMPTSVGYKQSFFYLKYKGVVIAQFRLAIKLNV